MVILGRPNVGKSTLLNRLVGQKVSITSRRPQTTRHNLLGIKSEGDTQILFVDTPGVHTKEPRALNRYMNKSARLAVQGVDVVIFLLDRFNWTQDDERVEALVQAAGGHKIIAVNKIDLIQDKSRLLPLLQTLQQRFEDADIVPLSATKNHNLDALEAIIKQRLPLSPFFFDDDQITDRSERFLVAEIIREKLLRQLGEEVPHMLTIQIERFEARSGVTHIDAIIYVEKEGQKRILIGKAGSKLKRVGADARRDMEALLGAKVMLNTWVKIKASWSDDERVLKSLGYD